MYSIEPGSGNVVGWGLLHPKDFQNTDFTPEE
jgi:hypothetical protein